MERVPLPWSQEDWQPCLSSQARNRRFLATCTIVLLGVVPSAFDWSFLQAFSHHLCLCRGSRIKPSHRREVNVQRI
jgi:hypothetical protein